MMKFFIDNFSVRVLDNTDVDLFSNKGVVLCEILSDASLFKYNPTVIIADPFLFVRDNMLYLFYEKQNKWYGKGRICMRKTSNLKEWSEEKVVLEEPFHLSFPYVFEDKGHYYMIPETGHDGSIRLYESSDDGLENWALKTKILKDGSDWVDSSLIHELDNYYLFTSKMGKGESYYKQCLFVSNRIEGPYLEHPLSPIYVGNDYGRNAGAVFNYLGHWMRPTQDCQSGYGNNVSMFKIDTLSLDDYKEYLYKKDIFDKEGCYLNGGHQYSTCVFKNRRVVAVDFKTRNYNLFELIRRVVKQIKIQK